jgi:hypothetical protein
MEKDTKKNSAPIAPTSADKSNASGLKAKFPSAKPEKGTLVKKKGAQAADPTKMAKPSRKNVMGATQANGRMFASAVKRQKPNFTAGSADLD